MLALPLPLVPKRVRRSSTAALPPGGGDSDLERYMTPSPGGYHHNASRPIASQRVAAFSSSSTRLPSFVNSGSW